MATFQNTILICPSCGAGELARESGPGPGPRLVCSKCTFSVEADPGTGFFDLRLGGKPQGHTLLIHEEEDFYANDRFMKFVVEENSAQLRQVIQECRPTEVLDIGCGNGDYGALFGGTGSFYCGLEPSDIPRRKSKSVAEFLESRLLVHNDPSKPLPVKKESVNLVTLLASYDHLPDRKTVIQDAWSKLKPGGYLLVNMTNYGFWLKRLINRVTDGSHFRHEDEHFCVHDPESLSAEIRSFVPEAEVFIERAGYVCIPNAPKSASFVYFSKKWIRGLNSVIKSALAKVLRLRSSGSMMIVVFRKPQSSR